MQGQLSIELLAILGLMLALITPAMFFAYTKSVEISHGFNYEKASETLERLSTAIAMVASSGEGSSVRIRLEIPPGAEVVSESFSQGSVLRISLGGSSVVKVIPHTVVMPPLRGGIYTLTIENKGEHVEVRVGE